MSDFTFSEGPLPLLIFSFGSPKRLPGCSSAGVLGEGSGIIWLVESKTPGVLVRAKDGFAEDRA